ncbi:MAG: aminoacyl-tRNA hydrolase [Elusimicrobiota bacterium]|jgi:PTH1 family peptidyl-tRNA hydrolase|nr:aminoacyl-tRNA hydrolase [Elusimicrobiota bacterium]
MKLIVGLGNIGDKYKNTRHNIGFEIIDYFALNFTENFSDFENCGLLLKSTKKITNEKIFLFKPTMLMNNSGIAIRKLKDYYKIDINDIFVIFDDISLDFGRLRIRTKGSSGGHNGIKSIIENFSNDQNFSRLKIGIGSDEKQNLSHFVLEKFSKIEMEKLTKLFCITNEIIDLWISDGNEKVMQKYNNFQLD